MRTWLLLASLVSITLAGCIGDDGDDMSPESAFWGKPAPVPGEYRGHPAYGFHTNADLPVVQAGQPARIVAEDGTVHWYKPVHAGIADQPAQLSAVAQVSGTTTGGGIAVFGPLAFIGGRASGPLQVVDITDPQNPSIVGEAPDVPVRDADTILFPDGRLIVITTSGGAAMFATDVTDPANPVLLSQFETGHGNHNIAVVPGTPIAYNSGSGGLIDIVDWSDPENPVKLGEFQNDENCHDITFHINPEQEKYRAYCAAYPETQIWDIVDPTMPRMHVRIPYPSIEQGLPAGLGDGTLPDLGVQFPLSFSHLAMVSHDANVLIVGDETGGGAINGCDFYLAGESGPLGNLWFYDLTDEENPVLLSHLSPSAIDDPADPLGSCTAHFGRVLEDTGYLVMGFYTSGVVLVDFQEPQTPSIVQQFTQEGSDIWDVQYHQGYLFTGDIGRGMDVLSIG